MKMNDVYPLCPAVWLNQHPASQAGTFQKNSCGVETWRRRLRYAAICGGIGRFGRLHSTKGLQAWASHLRLTWYQCSPLHGWASSYSEHTWSSAILKRTPPFPATNSVSHLTWRRLEDLGLPSCSSILHHPFDLTCCDHLPVAWNESKFRIF